MARFNPREKVNTSTEQSEFKSFWLLLSSFDHDKTKSNLIYREVEKEMIKNKNVCVVVSGDLFHFYNPNNDDLIIFVVVFKEKKKNLWVSTADQTQKIKTTTTTTITVTFTYYVAFYLFWPGFTGCN